MIIKEYTDERGIRRRVRVRYEYDAPAEGIPLDVFDKLDELYTDTPVTFRRELYGKLWQHGLIEPADFSRRDARQTFRQALQSSLACDARNTILYITGEMTNGTDA